MAEKSAAWWTKAKIYAVAGGLLGGIAYVLMNKGSSADVNLPDGAPTNPTGLSPTPGTVINTALSQPSTNGPADPYAADTTPLGGSPTGPTMQVWQVQPQISPYATTMESGVALASPPGAMPPFTPGWPQTRMPTWGAYAVDPSLSPAPTTPRPGRPVSARPHAVPVIRLPFPGGS